MGQAAPADRSTRRQRAATSRTMAAPMPRARIFALLLAWRQTLPQRTRARPRVCWDRCSAAFAEPLDDHRRRRWPALWRRLRGSGLVAPSRAPRPSIGACPRPALGRGQLGWLAPPGLSRQRLPRARQAWPEPPGRPPRVDHGRQVLGLGEHLVERLTQPARLGEQTLGASEQPFERLGRLGRAHALEVGVERSGFARPDELAIEHRARAGAMLSSGGRGKGGCGLSCSSRQIAMTSASPNCSAGAGERRCR